MSYRAPARHKAANRRTARCDCTRQPLEQGSFSTFDHSFRTLENALDAGRSDGVHFIYFSSSMVYGNFDGDAVREDRQCEPLGIYGALKFGVKNWSSHTTVFGLPYTIVRPSALYGERCVSRRVGQAFIEMRSGTSSERER